MSSPLLTSHDFSPQKWEIDAKKWKYYIKNDIVPQYGNVVFINQLMQVVKSALRAKHADC